MQNNPLYLQTIQQEGSESSLRFHYVVHCSLDAVEERCRARPLRTSLCITCLCSVKSRTAEVMSAFLPLQWHIHQSRRESHLMHTWECCIQLRISRSLGKSLSAPVSDEHFSVTNTMSACLDIQWPSMKPYSARQKFPSIPRWY